MHIRPDPTPPPRPDYAVASGTHQGTVLLGQHVVNVRTGTPLIADPTCGWRVAKPDEDWDVLATSGGAGGERVNVFKMATLRCTQPLFQPGLRYSFGDIDHTG